MSAASKVPTAMRRRKRRDAVDRSLAVYAGLVYLFLFVPIVIVVLFSFNSGRHVTQFEGFSMTWYDQAWNDPMVLEALSNSLQIATASAVIATVFGTAAALAVRRLSPTTQRVVAILTYLAVVIPAIVLGLSILLAFVMFADWANPWLAYLWPGDDAPELGLGKLSVIAGESIFGIALVMTVLQARLAQMDDSLERASADLYATPWRTLRQVTLPQLGSAIFGGFVLAFTFAFDDFIIAFFTRGQSQTLPILLFSSIRRGVNPSINAIATVLVVVTVLALLLALFFLTRRTPGGAALPLLDDTSSASREDPAAPAAGPARTPQERTAEKVST
ncbi:ABC transporter permease [Nocardioides caldifontis]|uniref:ABC transporter permease n=1 Tax=Nocardioides caldifontis TaxID=2588938 RepID=UPI0019395752|nr:ABC transporter permease [Nocardioides caldifontis]